jgi:L-ascorbate metabolism protein UlaG (beta-lactamase superfamily)
MTTIEWFGTTTFRVRDAGLHLFFDAYLDRLPGLAPVGLSVDEVDRADFVFVTHAHFDHLYGADRLALRTGATVVGSPETIRVLRACGVPDEQLLVVTGGETVDCGHGVRVRVIPALHSCLWAQSESDSGVACLGDLDVSAQVRAARTGAIFDAIVSAPAPVGTVMSEMLTRSSRIDGGQLAFLATTSDGTVLISGSAGYWRSLYQELRPDLALLSLSGRPNVDGEPHQGAAADFILEQVHALRPGRVAFCHHDPLVPGAPPVDIGAAVATLADQAPNVGYVAFEYATELRLS